MNLPTKRPQHLTRSYVRSLFDACLTYQDLTFSDIQRLRLCLACELADFNEADMGFEMYLAYASPCECIFTDASTQKLKQAYIRVDGSYFKDREAFSFNRTGLVGIAGWAGDPISKPFLDAFYRWLVRTIEIKFSLTQLDSTFGGTNDRVND